MPIKSKVAKTVLKYAVRHDQGSEDRSPNENSNRTFETARVVARSSVRHNEKRQRKKWQPPPGLTKQERSVLKQVRRRAKIYDEAFCGCCGCCRVGLDPIVGLIPVIGDFLTAFLAFLLVRKAQEADIPKYLVATMMTNVAIDWALGLVPLLGDVLDFFYKANTRNARILEEFLADRAKNRSLVEGGTVEVVDHRLPQRPEDVYPRGR